MTPDQAARQPADGEQPLGRRVQLDADFQLAPGSLVGSWFMARDRIGEITGQGMVVAEVQAGVYLLEFIDPVNATLAYQRLVAVPMMVDAEDGSKWAFYDTQHQMISAAAEHRLREEA